MSSKVIRETLKIARDLGIPGAKVEFARKHIQVCISGPLGSRKITRSFSTGDKREVMNYRSDLRRVAREIGALPA